MIKGNIDANNTNKFSNNHKTKLLAGEIYDGVEHLSAAKPCLHRGLLHAALCLNDVGFAVLYDNHTAV